MYASVWLMFFSLPLTIIPYLFAIFFIKCFFPDSIKIYVIFGMFVPVLFYYWGCEGLLDSFKLEKCMMLVWVICSGAIVGYGYGVFDKEIRINNP